MIDYLVPDFLSSFDTTLYSGAGNPGGGMRVKIQQVRTALQEKGVNLCRSARSVRNDIVLVEPLFFRGSSAKALLDFQSCNALIKIFYSSEMEPLRWPGFFLRGVLSCCEAVTHCCDYQRRLWDGLGVLGTKPLTDPINTDLFVPLEKQMQVVAVGRISTSKRSEFIRDLYGMLKPVSGVTTVYLGSATLWGATNTVDEELDYEIRSLADIFVEGAPHPVVAGYLGESAFFVANNIHDTFSESHAEALSAGCISVCGGHPVFSERPGYYVEPGADATFEKLSELTAGFTMLPDMEGFQRAREWAELNVSFATFVDQLELILSEWLDMEDGLSGKSVFK